MKYKPHKYQRYCIEFIKNNAIVAILLDMGMGKSSITLSAIKDLMYDSFEVSKVLIIAPLRVAKHTWSGEIEKWKDFKDLCYSIVVGTAAQRKKALQKDADIYIINRENVPWLIEQSGVPFDFDMVIIDPRDYRDLLEMEEMVGVAQEKIVEALETKAVQLEYNEAYRWARVNGRPDCKYTLLFHKDCAIPLREYFDKQKQNDATE